MAWLQFPPVAMWPESKLPFAVAVCGTTSLFCHTTLSPRRTVKIEGMQFVPATLTVRRGDKVVWQNKDVVPHTATAKGKFDSGHIATGGNWSHAMKKAGRHDYVCTFHPGMKAVVVVQ